jgi:glycosyltransferase involved in cell wall biosynthesis
MRIVELVNNLEIGGTERHVVDLATSLQARGHEVSVICLRRGGPLQSILQQAGIKLVMLDKPENLNPGALVRLTAYLRRQRIEVIHTHNPLVHHYGAVAGRMAGVPVIVNTIHGPANLSRKTRFKELLFGAACRLSDRVIAVCPSAYRNFMEMPTIPKSRLMTINNGIALGQFEKVQRRPDDGCFVFGIVGRLAEVKDHRTLLDAFSRVARACANCRLEILGDGPLRSDLEQQAQSLGLSDKVIFHGYGSDIPAFMRRIDASVLCSLSEGLPLSVLEAMASGVPVVGTDVGETRNLIEGADCGWICHPADPASLAEAMSHALNAGTDERHEMGARARRFVIKHYSLSRMTDEYEQLFLQLLDSRKRSGSRS